MPIRLNTASSRKALTLAGTLALLASFGAADARERKPDNLVPVGEPVDCLRLNTVRSSHVVDDKTIDFEVGKKIYRNTLPYSCPGLAAEERFLIETHIHQLCSVDTITVLHSYGSGLSRGATCGLGKFQQMEKAPK